MLTEHVTEALSDGECLELLEQRRVGRVAVSVGALPAIYPVDYRFVEGDILFPTGDASKARAALEGSVVAFEVDDVDPEEGTGWSVLVIGMAHVAAGTGPDGSGGRPDLIRIHPEMLSGRRIAEVIDAN